MPVAKGSTIAHYRITAKLGEGGMGVVWRARDTKLERDVALKVLPEAFASDPERLSRFDREAKLLARLNHSNIGQIYGLEHAGDVQALVLELVEGPTLAERIAQGPIPVKKALHIAKEIAEALEAAHEQGIIHRDLKPANVKVTDDGKVKVLDFGLAKALQPRDVADDENLSQASTLTGRETEVGAILGTPPYMAPEQARGRAVDKRADVWAFGAVLFEMLTGSRAFPGDNVYQMHEPDWNALPSTTPPSVVRILKRSLREDPRKRLRDIGDACLEIEEAEAPPAPDAVSIEVESPEWAARAALPWGIAAMMALFAAWSLFQSGRDRPPTGAPRAHLQIVLPEGLRLAVDTGHPTLALSPDGSRLVFVAEDGGARRLYLRELAADGVQAIEGSEGAASPFFSPDGEWIGFFAGSGLMKVPSASGAPLAVHTTTPVSVNRGATWIADQTVVFAESANGGLMLGSVAGEEQRSLTEWTQVTEATAGHSWPDALPDGQSVVFSDNSDQSLDAARLALLSLNTEKIMPLGTGGTNPRYSATGHILYGRGGALYALPFDSQRNARNGAEFKVLDGVISDGSGSVQYAVAGDGTVAFVSGPQVAGEYELVWIDREGGKETILEWNRPLLLPRLSPDASRLAVTVVDGSNLDILLFDLNRRTLTRRLTTDPGEDFGPVWHPDGLQLAIATEVGEDQENPGPEMALIGELGAAPEPLLRTPGIGNWSFPSSWSPEGLWLAFVGEREGPGGDILLLSPSDPGKPIGFLQTAADLRAPMFSPDGRWMAYVSNDTGPDKVYVRPFPGPGDRTLISTHGGTEPLWARSGRELYYREGGQLMVIPVDGSGEHFVAGESAILLDDLWLDEWTGLGASTANYDVSPDGSRFVMARRKNRVSATVIEVVLNWPETLLRSSEGTR